MAKYQVFGFCNPMVEQICNTDESFLGIAGLQKSASNLLSLEEYQNVESLIKKKGIEIVDVFTGGSGLNMATGLASLDITTYFLGGVGHDEHGYSLEEDLKECGVHPFLVKKEGIPTCTIYTLITSDAQGPQRTFAVYLGAAQEVEPHDIPSKALDALVNSEYFVVTGYKVMDSPDTTQKLIEVARKNDVKIIFDLSCPLHISQAKEGRLLNSILENGVHVLLANEEETEALYGVKVGSELEAYFDIVNNNFRGHADIVVQKLRNRGVIIATEHESFRSPAFNIYPYIVNSNGAGDGMVVCVVYALINRKDLSTVGRLGNFGASKIMRQVLPRTSFDKKELEILASLPEDALNLIP